jgi:2-oxoglutarate ferredoxin oxidoreductase subunit alpha
MMEKVEVGEQITRLKEGEIREKYPWATLGRYQGRERNIITSLDLDPARHERHNIALQQKYRTIVEKEARWETIDTDNAEYLFVAYGTSARICLKAMQLLREKGIKAGLLRPITLFPFPSKVLVELAGKVKGILSVEMSAGQMVEDIKLFVEGRVPVEHFGRMGGIVHSPIEVAGVLETKFVKG